MNLVCHSSSRLLCKSTLHKQSSVWSFAGLNQGKPHNREMEIQSDLGGEREVWTKGVHVVVIKELIVALNCLGRKQRKRDER